MWVIESSGPAIALLLIGMCAAGSWIQPMRYIAKKHKINNLLVLYFDWKLVHWLLVILFSILLGSIGAEKPSIFHNLKHASPYRIICAMLGGAAITSGDLLIFFGDALCGTALAFPICVGLCSAVGTIFVYIIQPKGNPVLLFAGVGAAFLAVIVGGLATCVKEREARAKSSNGSNGSHGDLIEEAKRNSNGKGNPDSNGQAKPQNLMIRGIALSVAAGLVYAAWSPLGTLAAQGKGCPNSFTGLSPHAVWLLFVSGMFLSNLPLIYIAIKWPFSPTIKPQSPFKAWRALRWSDHAWAAIPGVMSFLIFGSNFLAGPVTGFAISFGILNSNPLVAALWGIFLWREFYGVSARVKALFGGLIAGFVISIILIVLSGYIEPTHPLLKTCSHK